MSTIEAAEAVPALAEGPARAAGRRHALRPTLIVSVAVVTFFLLAALAPSLLTSRSPVAIDLPNALSPPSLAHPMGTDQSGRDVYARVVHGARQSLLIGLGATAIGLGLALLLGTLAGLGGRVVDGVVNRLLEVAFAFPVLLLALLLVAVFGASAATEIVAVGVGTAPGYARMVRGQVLAVKGSAYVEAAHALGHSFARVARRHVLPNALRPLVVVGTMGIGQSIVWASGLAFLGLGVAPPASEWGAMLDAGRNYVTRAWWLEVMPGLAIVAFTMSVTTIGRWVQLRLEGGLER